MLQTHARTRNSVLNERLNNIQHILKCFRTQVKNSKIQHNMQYIIYNIQNASGNTVSLSIQNTSRINTRLKQRDYSRLEMLRIPYDSYHFSKQN